MSLKKESGDAFNRINAPEFIDRFPVKSELVHRTDNFDGILEVASHWLHDFLSQ
jgi:hypothetical protein